MPTYSDAYYNSAAINGGDDTLGAIAKGPNGRRTYYYNAAGIYGGDDTLASIRKGPNGRKDFYYNAAGLYGGWTIPSVEKWLTTTFPPPQPSTFIELYNVLNAGNLISNDLKKDMAQIAVDLKLPLDDPSTPLFAGFVGLIGANIMYDTFRLLASTKAAARYGLTKQQQMLARNRAALIPLYIDQFKAILQSQVKDYDWHAINEAIYAAIHPARPTIGELQERYVTDGPYDQVDSGVFPDYNFRDGGFKYKNKTIPWSNDWTNISPELAAAAVGLLDKATNEGVVMSPEAIAAAAKGEYTNEYQTMKPMKKPTKKQIEAMARQAAGKTRPAKGSKEAKEKMAALRAMRALKSESGGKKKKAAAAPKKKKTTARKKKGGSAIWDSYIAKTYGY